MTQTGFSQNDTPLQIEQLETALGEQRRARRAAEAASQAKSELLATVSHELRTPMGAIISMADLLLATALDDKQRHYAATLHQSARGLLAVLNDILDYSRLDAGRFEINPVDFDFRELMGSIAAGLKARADGKGLESSLEIAEGCPARLAGDPVRIGQILNNLIDNALKFTETGAVRINVRHAREGGDTILRFDVRDTGIGVTEAQTARLFEPYTQASPSVSVTHGGTGLGLTIARRLAELMGGTLGCEGTEGRGSVFWFTVRVKEAASGAGRRQTFATPDPAAAGPLTGHVLIVEDNDVNQMLIAAYLDQYGLTHEAAANGQEALAALARGPFDLVLMDVMMPVMDGIEATKRIRALEGPVAKIPVVALTANAMKGDRESYLRSGMDAYVSKPINAAELFHTLAEQLGQNPLASTTAASG